MNSKVCIFKKLLSYLIVSIVMFIVGGEVVNAQRFYTRGLFPYGPYPYNWFYPAGSPGIDAWCLNPTSRAPYDYNGNAYDLVQSNVSLIPSDRRNAVINVINAGNNLNLSAGEKYYVTQAAIWKALGNIPYSLEYWITHSSYADAYETVTKTINEELVEPSMSINGADYSMDVDGNYMVSKDFSISGRGINGGYTVSINSGSADGACILYNNTCETQTTIPADANFKIRVDKPNDASGTVDATFTVVPQNTPAVYSLDTYIGINSYNVQNMAILRSTPRNLSSTQSVKGNYVNNTNIEVQKLDADTGEKVAGAKLYIEDENGVRIAGLTSTGPSDANASIDLPVGKYYLGETTQPVGYYYSFERVEFNVTDVGGQLQVLDHDGNQFPGNVPTISISNKRVKIKFRKVDESGNPIAGLKFTITSYANASVSRPNSVLCAYTDSNGYLTIPCNGAENTNNVRSDGEYTLGIDFGGDHDIYQIKEECEQDFCRKYVDSQGRSVNFKGISDVGIQGSGRIIISFNKNIVVTREENSNTPLITMTLVNDYHLDISKVDVTTGAELPGASMYITDLSKVVVEGANLVDDGIIDAWTSGTQPHTFANIEINHKYRLTEERAAEGYSNALVSNKNSIDFSMDADGKVTTYDIITGEVISDVAGSDYHWLVTNDRTYTAFRKISSLTGQSIGGASLKVCTKDAFDAAVTSTGDGTNCEVFYNTLTDERIEWTSQNNEEKIWRGLPAGEYYLVEVLAPEGYIQETKYKGFEIVDGYLTEVEMENTPTHIHIVKLDKVTKERVKGAKLEILNAEDRTIAKDASGNELVWITDGVNDWDVYGLAAGKYILVESYVPEAYEEGMIIDGVVTAELEFTLSDRAGDENIEIGIEVINAPKTGISTLNLFAIGGLMIFTGYETIKIYRRKALND